MVRCKSCLTKLAKEDIIKEVTISITSEVRLDKKSLRCPVCGNILLKKEFGEVF